MPWTLGPIALSPFGVGTPTVGATPPAGVGSGCRYINPGSRDYEIDPLTGQFRSMPRVRQRMLLILLTELGSATSEPGYGIRLPAYMGTGFEREVELAVRRACRQLTDIEGVVKIDDVITTRTSTGRCHIVVQYTDLTTGIPDGVSNAEELPFAA